MENLPKHLISIRKEMMVDAIPKPTATCVPVLVQAFLTSPSCEKRTASAQFCRKLRGCNEAMAPQLRHRCALPPCPTTSRQLQCFAAGFHGAFNGQIFPTCRPSAPCTVTLGPLPSHRVMDTWEALAPYNLSIPADGSSFWRSYAFPPVVPGLSTQACFFFDVLKRCMMQGANSIACPLSSGASNKL